jgi:hypothetical protein
MFSIKGTLKVKKDEQVISDKFKKREFVISDGHSDYPQLIAFQLAQDKTSLIDGHELESEITVHFNLRGREWTNKEGKVMYFNTLDAWRIEGGTQQNNAPSPVAQAAPKMDEESDLPF